MKSSTTLLLLLLPAALAFAPNQRVQSPPFKQTSSSCATTTALSMALEGQSPVVRKNVMAAAVSAAAMPALASVSAPVIATVTAWTTHSLLLPATTVQNNPLLMGGLFFTHWMVTNYFLQQFPDVGEVAREKGKGN